VSTRGRRTERNGGGRAARLAAFVGLAILAGGLATEGCAGVKAYERERLADPVMSLNKQQREKMREIKWLEAREGSTGGAGGAGGGCACN
jgi:hypothetical protein